MPTKVTPTTTAGGRRMAEPTREKLRATGRATWERMTPDQRAASLANLQAGRARGAPPTDPPAPTVDPPKPPAAPAPTGGSRNPLDDAPRARALAPGAKLNGHSAPPIFQVPDLPPMELGGTVAGEDPGELAGDVSTVGSVAVSAEQIGTLLAFPFELASLRRGDHWKLRADERAMLAEPLARKLNEHAAAARLVQAGGDWTVIVGGLAIVISQRVMEDNIRARDSAPAGAGGPVDGSRSSGSDPRSSDAGGDDPPRSGASGRQPGRLNGYDVGTSAPGGPPADPAEAPGRALQQAL